VDDAGTSPADAAATDVSDVTALAASRAINRTGVAVHVRRAAIAVLAVLAVGLAALAAAVLVGPLTLAPPFVEDDTEGPLAVESNDGYVTVERTVRADGEEATFAERRRVE
jgi:hypothetical protein